MYQPEDLYPIAQGPMEPKLHRTGKGLLILALGIALQKVASIAYDQGLGTYRKWKS